ncbi:uncharacterized protein LOC134726371 [Mytilus trossulus]|uniref:uncharacterized protein LOC134726371 n=1 Tax=Mytilus trossulus TaxID=6551 RepID=UPI0030059B50
MTCVICNLEKLSEEFCPENASTKCDHPCLVCLRCLVDNATKNGKCPYPKCAVDIETESDSVALFEKILSQMFTVYEASYQQKDHSASGEDEHVIITDLTGESIRIPLSQSMTINQLKDIIKERLGHEQNKQKLVFEGKDMQNEEAQLSSFGVTSNSKICLVVCLYAIPEYFDHVVFDLYWGFPMKETSSLLSFFGLGNKEYQLDFLDASCLMFCGPDHYQTIDYRKKISEAGVEHSGDRNDYANKTGHHTIDVHISKIPHDVTHLFFTLSAWNSPSISKYPNPSLKFFKASNRQNNLCKTSFSDAGNSQAVIMCSVSKSYGRWKIFESGQLSAGNAKDYNPLVATITELIAKGY